MNRIRLATAKGDNSHGPRRSTPGQGQQCFIHVMGRADEYADSLVGSYGQISAGCGPSLGEDFSETIWSVVIKVKPHVIEGDLIQHLRDLADSLERHTKPEDMQRTLAKGWQRREREMSEVEDALFQATSPADGVADPDFPLDPNSRTGSNFVPLGGDVVNIETRRGLPKPTVEQLRSSMGRHWAAGLRPPEIQHAVRRDCPGATLEEFNAAADAVWDDQRVERPDLANVRGEKKVMDTKNGFHVKDGWLHSGDQRVPSFTPVRATLSDSPGLFVAMTDEEHPIFAWHNHNRSTCNCQHTDIETYLPGKIPPIELAATSNEKATVNGESNVVSLGSQRGTTDEFFGGCQSAARMTDFSMSGETIGRTAAATRPAG